MILEEKKPKTLLKSLSTFTNCLGRILFSAEAIIVESKVILCTTNEDNTSYCGKVIHYFNRSMLGYLFYY